MKNIKIAVIAALVISLALFAGYKVKENKDSQAASKKNARPKTVPVTVINPKNGYFSTAITVSGTISPKDEVQITPKANGRLLSLLTEEGALVKKGQLIGTIDHSEIDSQIAQSEAKVRIAKANLNLSINGPLKPQIRQSEALIGQQEANLRELQASKANLQSELNSYQTLYDKGLITRQQLNSSQTQVEVLNQQIKAAAQQIESSRQALKLLTNGTRPEEIEVNRGSLDNAQAEVNLYKAQLANYNIISPISGVVTRKNLSSGSLVSQTTPIITVSTLAQPEVIMNVPENEIENIKIGQKIEVKTSANSKNVYQGRVKSIYPNIDNVTRLGRVKADLTSSHNLKLGMMLVCNIYTVEKNKALTIPTDSVLKDKKQTFVYTVVDNKAVKKDIVLGIEEPDTTEIISGLKTTEKVILKGNTFVKPGTLIEVQPELKIKG